MSSQNILCLLFLALLQMHAVTCSPHHSALQARLSFRAPRPSGSSSNGLHNRTVCIPTTKRAAFTHRMCKAYNHCHLPQSPFTPENETSSSLPLPPSVPQLAGCQPPQPLHASPSSTSTAASPINLEPIKRFRPFSTRHPRPIPEHETGLISHHLPASWSSVGRNSLTQNPIPSDRSSSSSSPSSSPLPLSPPLISYLGGPLMSQPITVHVLFYGRFAGYQQSNITTFLRSISATGDGGNTVPDWWSVIHRYNDSSGNHVTSSVSLGSTHHDSSRSQGVILFYADLLSLLSSLIANGTFPLDDTAVYAIITDSKTKQVGTTLSPSSSALCTHYCSWHGFFQHPSTLLLKLVLVGHPSLCTCKCLPLAFSLSPTATGDAPLDAQISLLAQHLAGSAINPTLQSWLFLPDRREPGEACKLNYGVYNASNLVGVSNSPFLVQENWDPWFNKCVLTGGS